MILQNQLSVKINEAQKEMDGKIALTQKQIDDLLVTVAAKNKKKGIYFDAYGYLQCIFYKTCLIFYY